MSLPPPLRSRPRDGFPLERWLREHRIEPRGIVHVGAHLGEEAEDYLAAGFREILFVEANPAIFPRLEAHLEFWRGWLDVLDERHCLRTKPRLQAVCAAADARDGHGYLFLSDSAHSSLLRPSAPELPVHGGVEVPSFTVPSLLRRRHVPVESINCLVLDVQGAERRVLAGARSLLPHLDLLVAEVNYEPRYRDCPAPIEVARLAHEAGLTEVLRTRLSPDYPAGDVYFTRPRVADASAVGGQAGRPSRSGGVRERRSGHGRADS